MMTLNNTVRCEWMLLILLVGLNGLNCAQIAELTVNILKTRRKQPQTQVLICD